MRRIVNTVYSSSSYRYFVIFIDYTVRARSGTGLTTHGISTSCDCVSCKAIHPAKPFRRTTLAPLTVLLLELVVFVNLRTVIVITVSVTPHWKSVSFFVLRSCGTGRKVVAAVQNFRILVVFFSFFSMWQARRTQQCSVMYRFNGKTCLLYYSWLAFVVDLLGATFGYRRSWQGTDSTFDTNGCL